jgi:hypothetical protein
MLTDEPQGRAAIAEQLGIEVQAVSNDLFALQRKGLAVRADGGWIVGGGEASAKRHQAKEPDAEPPKRETKRAKRETKPVCRGTKPRKQRSIPPPAVSVPDVNGRSIEFAIAESGAILFKITSGPRSGELGEIGHVDAMALYRLMSQVEFIRENA